MKYLRSFVEISENIDIGKVLKDMREIDVNNLSSEKLKDMGIEIYGLKCDNTQCSWEDMSIPFEEYKNNIDVPCPMCGESILTKDDYEETSRLIKSIIVSSKIDPEVIKNHLNNMSPEEMDKMLDTMNDYGLTDLLK